MDLTSLLIWLVVGAIAGWLAGLIFKGRGFGLLGNIIVGILGALLGGWLAPKLGISGAATGGFNVASLLTAIGGALILLILASFVKKAT